MYVKDSFDATKVEQTTHTRELLSLGIKPRHSKSFCLVCWYRPLISNADDATFENLSAGLVSLDK